MLYIPKLVNMNLISNVSAISQLVPSIWKKNMFQVQEKWDSFPAFLGVSEKVILFSTTCFVNHF